MQPKYNNDNVEFKVFLVDEIIFTLCSRNVPHTAEAYVAPVTDRVDVSRKAPSKWGGSGGDKCARCAKTVYLAEKKQAAGNVSNSGA